MYSMHSHTSKWAQGLELDSNGKLVGRPRGAELQQIREEQEGWGASSEKASHAFLENLAVTGAKAAGNAGLYILGPHQLAAVPAQASVNSESELSH